MAPVKKQITLGIIDDHNLFRKGLIKLIAVGDKESKFSVLFEASNGIEMKERVLKTEAPDIMLMDIDMSDMNGYECVDWLKKNCPGTAILVITMFETEEAVIKMLRLGVKGYLSKDIEVEDMHNALEAIANGDLYYAKFVSGIMANAIHNGLATTSQLHSSPLLDGLSENEIKFLEYACTDLKYEEIAEKMFASPKTIDGYRATLFKKFNTKNRVGLVLFAIKNKLVLV